MLSPRLSYRMMVQDLESLRLWGLGFSYSSSDVKCPIAKVPRYKILLFEASLDLIVRSTVTSESPLGTQRNFMILLPIVAAKKEIGVDHVVELRDKVQPTLPL